MEGKAIRRVVYNSRDSLVNSFASMMGGTDRTRRRDARDADNGLFRRRRVGQGLDSHEVAAAATGQA